VLHATNVIALSADNTPASGNFRLKFFIKNVLVVMCECEVGNSKVALTDIAP
jgi:hypothetical protein